MTASEKEQVHLDENGEGGAPSLRVIKRYANRKLYDTQGSSYVTLQEIATFVRAGEEVQIIDNKSKEDLTGVTLAQIIYEEEKKGGAERAGGASVGLLRSFIEQGGERILSSLRGGPMAKLMTRHDGGEVQPEAEEGRANEVSLLGDSPRDSRAFALSSPREVFDELQRLADDRIRGVLAPAMGHLQFLQDEVQRLRLRIQELEIGLAKKSAEVSSRKKKVEADPKS